MDTPRAIHREQVCSRLREKESPRRQPPDVYQVVIECRDEAQQRELFDRLRREGLKVRLLCL
jgi:hypothetical protein